MHISYSYVETKWRPYECNTCSNDESTKFNKGVSIIMNFNWMDIYINKNMVPTHSKKIKSIIHSKLFTFNFFWKIPCIGKLFMLENCLNSKIVSIERKLIQKNICIKIYMYWKKNSLKNMFALNNCLHWRIIYIEKLLLATRFFYKKKPLGNLAAIKLFWLSMVRIT